MTLEADDARGAARVQMGRSLPAGEAVLHVDFDAAFNPRLVGLYRVKSTGDEYGFVSQGGGPATDLPMPSSSYGSSAWGVSADGAVIVGLTYFTDAANPSGYFEYTRWAGGGGASLLGASQRGTLGFTPVVSADGKSSPPPAPKTPKPKSPPKPPSTAPAHPTATIGSVKPTNSTTPSRRLL